MNDKKKPTRAQLDAAMMRAHSVFERRKNLTGVDVGYRYVNGKRTNELCIRVHVERKLPLETVPESEVFPSEIDGIPLDVIEGPYRVSRATKRSDHRDRQSHVIGGVSCSRSGFSAGTLGAVVIDERTGKPAILSNWHVMAGAKAMVGDSILQPGGLDGGVPVRDEVAKLERWILETAGDAAIATLTGARGWLPLQFGSFAALNGEVRNSKLGEILVKAGRTTAQTTARVDGEGIYRLSYEVRPGEFEPRDIRGFKLVPEKHGNPDNVEVSSGGDSGSVWYHADSGDAVGLHFAGETNPNPMAEHAIACNLTEVVDKLEIRIATVLELLSDEGIGGADTASSELTPVPDWPWPNPPWPWPSYPPGGGWPYPIPIPPRPKPWPGPLPLPFESPTIRDPFGPRPLPPSFDLPNIGIPGSGGSLGLETTDITSAALRTLVAEVILSAYPGHGGTLSARTPKELHGSQSRWLQHYRTFIEQPLIQDPRLFKWTMPFSDGFVFGLYTETYSEIYRQLLIAIGREIGVDPWGDLQ